MIQIEIQKLKVILWENYDHCSEEESLLLFGAVKMIKMTPKVEREKCRPPPSLIMAKVRSLFVSKTH